jgi:ribokinase
MAGAAADGSLVLVVGDANPDLILRGDVVPRFGQAEQLLSDAALVIGGSAAITAHAFARLGRPVALVAALGRDDFGARLRQDLAGAGVRVDAIIEREDVPTGITVVLSGTADRAILTLPGTIGSLTATEVQAAVAAERSRGLRHVHVSSLFLLPQLARDLPGVLRAARTDGVTTSLDTNDDPAGRWQGVDVLLPHLDVLLPNRAEVTALAGEDDPRKAAVLLAASGPLVVVKDGPDGAFLASPSGSVLEVAAEPATPIDTTGAGDTFNAAFLDAWLRGQPLPDCLRRGVLAGGSAVSALGGTAGQPSAVELDLAVRAPAPLAGGRP